jgi:hypothetical protein
VVSYERLKPFRLTGPDGPIAAHVMGLPAEDAYGGWKLDAGEFLGRAGVTCEDGQPALVMDMGESRPGEVCLYELRRISGACREKTTNLAFEFQVLVDDVVKTPAARFKTAFDVASDRPCKIIQETLALNGGPSGGAWKWDAPAMNIGATVVAPRIPAVPAQECK